MMEIKTLLKAHSGAWIESRVYRVAWLTGPLVVALFVFGSNVWITPGNKLRLLPAPVSYTMQEYEAITAGLRSDDPATLAALKAAAEANDSRALNYMGILHDPTLPRIGSLVTPNRDAALAYYEKSAAAGGGVIALENAGLMLAASGKFEEGCKILYRAFEVDNQRLETKAAVGECMANIKEGGDRIKGLRLMEEAATSGYARAYQLLGSTYYSQNPPDGPRALSYYEKAVAGNADDHGESHLRLGYLYHRGLFGVPQDMKKGLEHFLKALDQGSAAAATDLSFIYSRGGYGAPADFKKAVEYATVAAKYGNAVGYFNLYVFYRDGNGVKRDLEMAAKYLLNAISLGHKPALEEIRTYKSGPGATSIIMAVQSKLARAVIYTGPVDGQLNPILQRSLEALLGGGRLFD